MITGSLVALFVFLEAIVGVGLLQLDTLQIQKLQIALFRTIAIISAAGLGAALSYHFSRIKLQRK